MIRQICFGLLINVTIFIGLPALGFFIYLIPAAIDEFLNPKGSFPLPSMLPAFMGGEFTVWINVAGLWFLYFFFKKKPTSSPT